MSCPLRKTREGEEDEIMRSDQRLSKKNATKMKMEGRRCDGTGRAPLFDMSLIGSFSPPALTGLSILLFPLMVGDVFPIHGPQPEPDTPQTR